MKTIKKMIYDELIQIIPITDISFIAKDKTIQVLSQGKLLYIHMPFSGLTETEMKAMKLLQSWSVEIYGL